MGGGGECEGAAVEDVPAALPGDQCVEGAECSSFAGQDEDVGGGAFPEPVPGWEPGLLCEVGWCVRVLSGEPVIEQAEREADAAGDRRDGVIW